MKLSVDENGIVVISLFGSLTPDRLETLQAEVTAGAAAIKEISEKQGGKVKILMDLSGFDGNYDAKAMDIMADFAKQNRDYVEKTAGFSNISKAKMAGEVVSALADRENIQFFDSKEEALAWLNV